MARGVGQRLKALPHARARKLALPAIASNIAVPVVGLTDTAMLGHFSDASGLGAVGLGSAVISAVFWAFAFLRPGTTSLVGRSLGAADAAAAIAHVRRALATALALGALWLLVQWWLVPPLVTLLAQGADAGPLAQQYTLIRGLSLPAVLLTLVAVGYFIGAQNTRTPLVIATTVAVTNIVGDVALVGGLGYGAAGAAWATFGAEWLGAVLAMTLLLRAVKERHAVNVFAARSADLNHGWKSLWVMNSHLMGRSALLMGALTVVASLGAREGDAVLAANAIGLQMMYVASYALDGYATAGEAMVAQELGARKVRAMHQAAAASSLAGMAIALAMTLAFSLGGDAILAGLTSLEPVTAAAQGLWWAVIALPLVSGASWMLDGIFLGAGRSADMLASMAVSVLAVFAPIVAATLALGTYGNAWLWLAFLAMNITRAATLAWRYWRLSVTGRWLSAPTQATV